MTARLTTRFAAYRAASCRHARANSPWTLLPRYVLVFRKKPSSAATILRMPPPFGYSHGGMPIPQGWTVPFGRVRFRKAGDQRDWSRSEEHTSELQSRPHLVCRLLLEKKKKN